MNGRITFDHRLSLDVLEIALRRGRIELRAFGRVARRPPAGVVPVALYGADNSLVAVTRCDWDRLAGTFVRKGDCIDLSLILDIESMRGAM